MAEKFADVTVHIPFLAKHPILAWLLEEILGLTKVRRWFGDSANEENPFAGVVRRVGLEVRLEGLEDEMPAEGATVIVANHSHGGPDAIALASQCLKIRPDTLILANAELTKLPGISQYFLPVSLLENNEEAAAENAKSLRAMLRHIRQGGCLVVFPAGRVAYWQDGEVKDPPWNDHVVTLMQRMKATVVPIWFFGGVPAWMQILSKLSGFVRTALIPRGLVEMRGKEIVGRVGKAFPTEDLKVGGGRWLRRHLESLRETGN